MFSVIDVITTLPREALYASPAGGAHLNLYTEAIALLFQCIHFSFLSCHGGGWSGMLLMENETVTLKQDREREEKTFLEMYELCAYKEDWTNCENICLLGDREKVNPTMWFAGLFLQYITVQVHEDPLTLIP